MQYWIGAYSELLAFKDQLLTDLETGIQRLSGSAAAEIRELDVSIIELQKKRYQARLAFWRSRQQELAGGAFDARVS